MGTLAFQDRSPASPSAPSVEAPLRVKPILGLALALRLGVVALFVAQHGPTWLFTRAPELASLANSLCRGDGLSSPFGGSTGPSAFLAPGYPLVIALVFLLFGSCTAASAIAILGLQTGFAILTLWATMATARALFGEKAARLAGIAGAIGLPLLWIPAIFWETSLSTLLLSGAVALAVRCRRRPEGRNWAMLGFAGGVALLVNPALGPAMIAILGWTAFQTRSAKPRGAIAAITIMLAIFSPWPIRNALVFHRFIPLRSNFGLELWMGNREGGNGDFDDSLFPIRNQRERAEYAARGEVAYMNAKAALARSFIGSHPAAFAATTARRAAWFWTGAGGEPSAWLGELHATLTSLFGFSGLLLLATRRKAVALLFALPLALFPLPYYISHADLRFRLVLDPLLIILAAYAVERLGTMLASDGADPGEPPNGADVFADNAPKPFAANSSRPAAPVRG